MSGGIAPKKLRDKLEEESNRKLFDKKEMNFNKGSELEIAEENIEKWLTEKQIRKNHGNGNVIARGTIVKLLDELLKSFGEER